MPKRHRQPDVSSIAPSTRSGTTRGVGSRGRLPEEDDADDANDYLGDGELNDNNLSSPPTTSSAHDGSAPGEDTDSVSAGSEEAESSDADLIDVDFGVFDMRKRDVDAIMHLMDQLCPDKMNEVDRDQLGEALLGSPFTSVVRIADDDSSSQDDDGGSDGEGKEEDVFGVASILDFAHDARLETFLKLLKSNAWRTVAPGVSPTEMLTALEKGTGHAKCVLLVGEYLRNVPLELTSHISADLLKRYEEAFSPAARRKPPPGLGSGTVCATFPCMFAVLSKIQRAVEGSDSDGNTKSSSSGAGNDDVSHKKRKRSVGQTQDDFDMKRYVFWREEDAVLFDHREKRIAVLAYQCRSQYDGQAENNVPISILYVLSHEGLKNAMAEIKKLEVAKANVLHY
uniref:Uncharacterized protein TCIL3000_11_9360 n=1 Tax=Trypanosoma congolense (strain IL3000) TaxID=1068625 RepID=G0V1F4_TRYCI|nr:unnamed protein product [Trypanosoma congolense IL3000]